MPKIELIQGDCLEKMKDIPDGSVDLVLTDLPYGRTVNKWDSIISFNALWEQYNRVSKKTAAIILFADGLFMADLMNSNRKNWRYNLVWDKVLPSGFLNANRMPLRRHEELCVFYKSPPVYNPQKTKGNQNHSKGKVKKNENNNYGEFGFVDNSKLLGDMKHPTSIMRFSKPHSSIATHPTEKPVSLLENIIKTYTNEDDAVLDSCMGSGSTGVACVNTNRNFIGIELDAGYFKIAEKRINENI